MIAAPDRQLCVPLLWVFIGLAIPLTPRQNYDGNTVTLPEPAMTEITHQGIRLRPLPHWPDYYAGQDGHIYSDKGKGTKPSIRCLKEQASKKLKFLRTVTLYHPDHRYDRRMPNGTIKSCVKPAPRYVHRLVASVWLSPQPSPKHGIDHEDGNRGNNRPDNLRWMTAHENIDAYWTNKRASNQGERCLWAKLTAEQVLEIRRLDGVMSNLATARQYGVSHHTIRSIWRRKSWRHLPEEIPAA